MNQFAAYLCLALFALTVEARSVVRHQDSSSQSGSNSDVYSANSSPSAGSIAQFGQGLDRQRGVAFEAGAGFGVDAVGAGAGAGVGPVAGAGVGSAAPSAAAASVGAAQPQTIVTKDFYIHSAPEEPEENLYSTQNAGESIRRNYRVVFIKAPSPKFTVNTATVGGSSNEERTAIYVLSRRPEINVVQQQGAQSTQKLHKPEVYFIKYETPEEAQLAQQQIQANYDALEGVTNVSDEGVAPVHSVIGSAGSGAAAVKGDAAKHSDFVVVSGSNLGSEKVVSS